MKFGRSSPARTSGRTPCCDPAPRLLSYKSQNRGEVSERLKELASKASVGETRPWVQIPPSPPNLPCKIINVCAGSIPTIKSYFKSEQNQNRGFNRAYRRSGQ